MSWTSFLALYRVEAQARQARARGVGAHATAIHLVERVLPQVPFRQWTLLFPKRIRWHLARDVGLCTTVLGLFVRALFAYQRRRGVGSASKGRTRR